MNKRQQYKYDPNNTKASKYGENRLFLPSQKEEQFSAHLNRLNQSRAQSAKQSDRTFCSQYQSTFEKYSKNISLIDKIQDTFDNGKITDLFNQCNHFTNSEVYHQLPNPIRSAIQEMNFFYEKEEASHTLELQEPLNISNYARAISELRQISSKFEEITEIKLTNGSEQTKPAVARSETVATQNPVESKVDLILNQINFEKKRRDDCPLYVQAMEIKLNQFIDHILGDDDDEKYIGLSLQDKGNQVARSLHSFKGKRLEGWIVLVLIEIFFQEFKELQLYKVQRLREQRKSEEEKHEVKSQFDLKSVKSNNSSIHRGKYSEPNSRRNIIQEQQWIGALK